MTSAPIELQKVICKTLGESAALTNLIGERKVFDHTPSGTPFPYISFGKESFYDWSMDSKIGFEHFFTLHVWLKSTNRKEVFEVIEVVKSCLHDQRREMDSSHLINLRFDSSEVRYNENISAYQGLLHFRAVTETDSLSLKTDN